MTITTEREILERLADSFKVAVECAENLASLPAQGPSYVRLREHLKVIENCIRQGGHWREDGRWFRYGMFAGKVHQGALQLILGHNPRWEFQRLAQVLRGFQHEVEQLRDKAPPKLGTILPDPLEGPLRQGRPVQVLVPENDNDPMPDNGLNSGLGGQAPELPVSGDSGAPPRKLIIPDGITVH